MSTYAFLNCNNCISSIPVMEGEDIRNINCPKCTMRIFTLCDKTADDTTPDEYYEWASNLADGNWNQAAQQAVNDKKDKNNETKSQTDQKCTCPIHRLSQQGCPKLRGEAKCSE